MTALGPCSKYSLVRGHETKVSVTRSLYFGIDSGRGLGDYSIRYSSRELFRGLQKIAGSNPGKPDQTSSPEASDPPGVFGTKSGEKISTTSPSHSRS